MKDFKLFLDLIRIKKPIGIMLLFWPCLWGLTLGNDFSDKNPVEDNIFEFNLVCPFNIIAGKCPSITENSGRTGMAEAQVELAKRTINSSTSSALNRLKWIRRNKDKQNLSNQNIKLNFSNNMLSSLKELPITSFKKISTN